MVPLITRSHYSLLWGTASIPELCAAARRLGYDRLALTDTDNLCGLWPFLEACRHEGLTPIVGAELTQPGTRRRAVCLAVDENGYSRLCRLLTRRHLQTDFDLARELPLLSHGLIVLTGHPGLLRQWARAGVEVAAALPRGPLPADHPLRTAASEFKVPAAAVPGSFFLQPQDYNHHCLLRAIACNTTIERLPVDQTAPAGAWLAGPQEYARRFAAIPEALAATRRLADRISFSGPRFGLVMPPWSDAQGRPAAAVLRREAYRGARRRYGDELPEPVVDRLEHELKTIDHMNFSAYFLIVRDIVRHSPRTCGRGSGAASLVAYSLGITNVCPVKHNLYFGRFLNPGRRDPPDIDVDFAWDERDAVIRNVLEQYGDHAALVSSHILFQPRLAVRETAKVFGLTEAEIGQVTARLPLFRYAQSATSDLAAVIKSRPETRALDLARPWPAIIAAAQRLIGAPRHLSVHPGGVVITPRPVSHYVPVQRAAKGIPIVQWEKDGVEEAGLVKIDLLGNRSLGVIRDALANARNNGHTLDESCWEPTEDPATCNALARGDTMGCFYIESPAMRQLQQKAGRGDFEHLVIHSSIIRPAANDFIQEYLKRLHGAAWQPIHPLLEDVLEETLGIMVYQEDVSRAAMALAGFDDAAADNLRKIMARKNKTQQLQDYQCRFAEGARRNGLTEEQIAAVWAMMLSFSGYSFCKPHSASYAQVSYQAAYLKVHFPAEFMAAVISNQGGFYSTFAYVSEARRLGVTILPPDVTRSADRWLGRDRRLQVGLMAVGGLSTETLGRIVRQRKAASFSGLTDFWQRVRPDEAETRALIQCGALDCLAPEQSRAQIAWSLARLQAARRLAGQTALPLFGESTVAVTPPPLPEDDPLERLRREFRVLGFLCDRHPMTLYAEAAGRARATPAAEIGRHVGRRLRLAAWLITGKAIRTRSGEKMEFLTFEDETGCVETTFFPRTYERFCHLLDHGRPYLLEGIVEENWGAATLTVEKIRPLSA